MLLRCFVVTENWIRTVASPREEGATSVEYGLMVGVLGLGIIGSFTYYVKTVGTAFNKVPTTWPS
jgi:Flp pilus assembly pilin Flp